VFSGHSEHATKAFWPAGPKEPAEHGVPSTAEWSARGVYVPGGLTRGGVPPGQK